MWAHSSSAQRLEETLDALKWTYETAVEYDVLHVVDLGDLFHDRIWLDAYAFERAYRLTRDAFKRHGIRTHFCVGNHDQYFRYRADVSSLTAFEEFGSVISVPGTHEVAGFECDFMPYCEDCTPAKIIREAFDSKRSDILFFHAAVDGALVNSRLGIKRHKEVVHDKDQAESDIDEGLSKEDMEGWKFAYGGHYHCPQVVNHEPWIEYIGSTMQHSFSEAGEIKHVVVIDLDNYKKRIEIDNTISPKFEIIDARQCTPDLSIGSNARVRLVVDDKGDEATRKLRKSLIDSGALTVSIEAEVKEQIDKQMHRAQIRDAVSMVQDAKRLVRTYARLQAPGNLDYERLVKIGDEITAVASKEKKPEDVVCNI